jgi:predicted ferric reductase
VIATQLPWFVARSSGLTAWALLGASVLAGLLVSRKTMARPGLAWLLDLHRFLGGLAVAFVAVHVGSLLADSYIQFDLVSVLVPLASHWHPVAVAWGITGMYLLVAIEVTSLLRTRLPRSVWRFTHMASLPLFAMTTIHALTAGTDGRTWAFVGAASTITLAVAALAWVRLARIRPRFAHLRSQTT